MKPEQIKQIHPLLQITFFFCTLILTVLLWFMFLLLFFNLEFEVIINAPDNLDKLVINTYIGGLYLIIISLIFTFQVLRQEKLSEIGLKSSNKIVNIFKGYSYSFIIMGTWFLLMWAFNLLSIDLNNRNGLISIITILFSAVFFALLEEMFFRGWLFHVLIVHYRGLKTVIIQAVIFTICHFPQFNTSLIGLFLAGIILGFFRLKTNDIWMSFGMHMSWIFIMNILLQNKWIIISNQSQWLTGNHQPHAGVFVIVIFILLANRELKLIDKPNQ